MADRIKCGDCGRFISTQEMECEFAKADYTNEFGPEVIVWRCEKCVNAEMERLANGA